MTDLEKIKNWIAEYPGHDILSQFHVDYTDKIPANGGIYPSGLTEIDRRKTIKGDVRVKMQYNFGIYYIFTKAPGDDEGAEFNSQWVMDFQKWVCEQSALGRAPLFGSHNTQQEKIKAQDGVLYAADDEGTAVYMVQLSVQFENFYKKER